MHLYTEGNSPSLRPQLGVGWNRALPAPFSFQNGWLPDSVNDYLSVPTLKDVSSFYGDFTVEFWVKPVNSKKTIAICITDGSSVALNIWFQTSQTISVTNANGAGSTFQTLTVGALSHVVVKRVGTTVTCYVNGGAIAGGSKTFATYAQTFPANISTVTMGYANIGTVNQYQGSIIDEFRLYTEALSDLDVFTNYNGGMGNNPLRTEKLKCWFNFQSAESDTSLWPGGLPTGWTSGAWGIRDKTNNNNHAMQSGQTNNATLGGTIQTF